MPDTETITLVTSWEQALVAVVLIVAVLVWPGIAAWLQARRSAVTVDKVHQNLTTNNGGSHTKDQLDRIEGTLAEHGLTLKAHGEALGDLRGRVSAVEDHVTRPGV